MILINFSHALSEPAREAVRLLYRTDFNVIPVPVQLDLNQSIEQQMMDLVDTIPLTQTQWETEQILVVLPALSAAAFAAAAILHGRMGYWPAVLALKQVSGVWDFGQIVDGQNLRAIARQHRF